MSDDLAILLFVLGMLFVAYLIDRLCNWWADRKDLVIEGIDFSEFPHESNYTKQIRWVRERLTGRKTYDRASFMIELFYDKFPRLDTADG